MDLTYEQCTRIEALIPSPQRKKDGRGRLRKNPKDVLNGILWVLRTGGTLERSAATLSPASDVPPLVSDLGQAGGLQILTELGEDLYQRGAIDIRETFIDGSFTPAKKGVILSALQSMEKGPRSWQSQTLLVFLSPSTYKALHPTK